MTTNATRRLWKAFLLEWLLHKSISSAWERGQARSDGSVSGFVGAGGAPAAAWLLCQCGDLQGWSLCGGIGPHGEPDCGAAGAGDRQLEFWAEPVNAFFPFTWYAAAITSHMWILLSPPFFLSVQGAIHLSFTDMWLHLKGKKKQISFFASWVHDNELQGDGDVPC